MRHEDATDAIDTVRRWFGGALSQGTHIDAEIARLISTILEAIQLSGWLHDNGNWDGNDSQPESVDLLRAIVRACDMDAIRQAVATAQKYTDEIRAEKEPSN